MEAQASKRHWADELAERIANSGRAPLLSTGISPSGEIHIGNMREVLTADAVYRALRDRGVEARFNYVADNFDPLRKVYPFLDAESYRERVGEPLSELPAPHGAGSYSDYFLEPFLASLRRLAVEVEVERADQMYKSGLMTPYIVMALEQRDRIAAILSELTGKRMDDAWSPFTVRSPVSGKMLQARVLDFSASEESIDYEAADGERGTVPMAGGGKLIWRIDWPARWMALGVTVEPFGKDHSTRGGSYDTGIRIVREIFGGEPPFPIPYEWIQLKGRGDMSSSKGNVLSIADMLEVVPPEALRYLVMRERPQRSLTFDPGLPLLQLVDQLDDPQAKGRDERAVELSQVGAFRPVGVPFKHLVVVAQIVGFDVDKALQVLTDSGYDGLAREAVAERLAYAERWLKSFAPDDIRFEVAKELPSSAVAELDPDQRGFLADLGAVLGPQMDGDAVHGQIYEVSQKYESKPARLFQAIYLALLGKARGPRAGQFIALVGPEFCAERFRQAAGATTTEGS